MIHINGMGALGDDAGGMPTTELLSSSWGDGATAPTPGPSPRPSDRRVSNARPPVSPSELVGSTVLDGFPAPTKGGEKFLGIVPLPSWMPKWAAYAVMLVGGAFAADYVFRHYIRGGRRVATNPKGGKRGRSRAVLVAGRDDDRDERDLVERARDFREKFHWGIKGRKIRRAKVSKSPKVATKLGELVNVTYKTKKRGEKAEFFVHEFGEEGGRRPTLAMDIENKKLHIVGGDYDVTADGIKD